VSLRRRDEKLREALRADVINVADHLVRRERRRHVVGAADVALKQRELRERVAADRNRRPGLLISSRAAALACAIAAADS